MIGNSLTQRMEVKRDLCNSNMSPYSLVFNLSYGVY
jgi:hypothetical protein